MNSFMAELSRPAPSRIYRWLVLLFISLAMGGNYYIYDSINALERIFIDKLGYSATGFGWLNASYSVAAVLTLLIGGIIIDRIGTKKAIAFFAVLCLMGAILTAIRGQLWVMIVGRTVLGLGAESMIVAVTTGIAKWFKGKELSFAFGINLTIARLASVAADNSPTWAKAAFYPQGPSGEPSWQNPLWIAVGAGVLSVVCALVYWALESRAEARYELGRGGQVDKLEFEEENAARVGFCGELGSSWFGSRGSHLFNCSFRSEALEVEVNVTLSLPRTAASAVAATPLKAGWPAR